VFHGRLVEGHVHVIVVGIGFFGTLYWCGIVWRRHCGAEKTTVSWGGRDEEEWRGVQKQTCATIALLLGGTRDEKNVEGDTKSLFMILHWEGTGKNELG
jgi:hypothetical protein